MSAIENLTNHFSDLKLNPLPENCVVYVNCSFGGPNWLGVAGIGVWFGENHPLNVSQHISDQTDVITGEVQSCLIAVNLAREHGAKALIIRTDCLFIIDAMTFWIPEVCLPLGWKELNKRDRDMRYREDLEELYNACNLLQNVTWEYIGAEEENPAGKLAMEAISG